MHPFKYILLLLPLLFFYNAVIHAQCKSSVLVCYGNINPELIKGYNYVILEAEFYSKEDITLIKQHNKIVLSYISLGEVNINAKYYEDLKELVNRKNMNWGSYLLNISDKKTQEVLLKEIARRLDKGFDGLFLDNLDNYTIHGPQTDQQYDLLYFLKTIRRSYPSHFFMQNSGLLLINYTNNLINAIAIESIASSYNFQEKTYALREEKEFIKLMNSLEQIKKDYDLSVILIEYADEYELYQKICERLKKTDFLKFIGKIELQQITKYSKN